MVKRSVTLLEETIFEHVTIHKLMIYIYCKMKMSHDPLLAVIRTNACELKKQARCDPLVLIASSKTILKTLLNFTRLTCISEKMLHFITTLMQDVYARMRKLWEIYQIHGSYEIPKKIKASNSGKGKENVDTKVRQQKKSTKKKYAKNKSYWVQKNDVTINDSKDISNSEPSNSNIEIASQIRDTVVDELTKDGSYNRLAILEKIKSLFTDEELSEFAQISQSVETKETPPQKEQQQQLQHQQQHQEVRSPKKRKIKKWSLGIFHAKKRRKSDQSNKTESKPVIKNAPKRNQQLHNLELATDNFPDPESVMEKNIQPKEYDDDDENSLETFSNMITKDSGWGERLKIQREYYLNEMSKLTLKLNKAVLPTYTYLNKISSKLGVCSSTYGYTLKELMAMDPSQIVKSMENVSSPILSKTTSYHSKRIKCDPSNEIIVVGLMKATCSKKRFIYECTNERCSIETTQLQVLYNHISLVHQPFTWDWTCSKCGTLQEVNLLKNADLLDMAMYHLGAYHSVSALKRNPVELDFTSMEMKTKPNTEPPTNKHVNLSVMNGGPITSTYCSQLYKCSNCHFSTGLFSEAFNHFSIELSAIADSETVRLFCIYCGHIENDAGILCEHIEQYHASSIFLCSECCYRSVSLPNTLNHYYDEHEGIEENKDILLYVNAEPVGIKSMAPVMHPITDLTRYVCKHPQEEEFITLVGSKFIKHVTACPNQGGKKGTVKKFECSICSTRVGAPYKLKQHFETHQVVRYLCVYCGLGTSSLPRIKEHLYKFHMYWQPRFIIREDFNDCPAEMLSQYSSLMEFKTDMESLIEVTVEISDNQIDNSKIKLQMISGDVQKWDSQLDKLYDANCNKGGFENIDMKDISGLEANTQEKIIDKANIIVEENNTSFPINGRTRNLRGRVSRPAIIDLTDDEINLDEIPISTSLEKQKDIIEIPSDSEETSVFNNNKEKTPKLHNLLISPVNSLRDINLPSTSAGITPLKTSNESQSDPSEENKSNVTDSTPVNEQHRPPEIRVIAAAKMDNFSASASNLLQLNKILGNVELNPGLVQLEPSSSKTNSLYNKFLIKPKILRKQKSRMYQSQRITAKEESSKKDALYTCPYCQYSTVGYATFSNHISRTHEMNNSGDDQLPRVFACAKCQTEFQAFASLHKHMENDHENDKLGFFKIFVKNNLVVRKNIKICFLCSTLIVTLEELYKHPDICPFAHTTGTPFNSSIVYATGKSTKAFFAYQKGDIKVNKTIVELLQPHLPKTPDGDDDDDDDDDNVDDDVPIVKRAVAKKSTGPRPPCLDSNGSPIKRAVAKKSTGPYIMPPPSNSDTNSAFMQ